MTTALEAPLAVGAVTIAEESFATAWPDIQDLLRQHWHEIATYHDIPLSVNEAAYRKASDAGTLCIVTLRQHGALIADDGRMIGYAVFFVVQHPHYDTTTMALQDVVYLDPEFRRGLLAMKLIAFSEVALKARGCVLVHQHAKVAHPALGLLLQRRGYRHVENLYVKRLDDEGLT